MSKTIQIAPNVDLNGAWRVRSVGVTQTPTPIEAAEETRGDDSRASYRDGTIT